MVDLQLIKIQKEVGPEPAATEPKPRRSQP